MKKILRLSAIALIALVAIAGVISCDGVFSLLASPTVTVVDARTGTGILNAVVTLTPIAVAEGGSKDAITGTSGSTGVVVFSSQVPYGSYTVTGALSGYVFIPFEATIAGWNTDIGKIFGVTTAKGDDTNAVSIFLTWGDTSKDLDAHFTYPTDFESSVGAGISPWNAYYELPSSGRDHVYFSVAAKNTSTNFAFLDVDDTNGEGPETITLSGMNTGSVTSGSAISVDSTTAFIGSVLPVGTYYWMGAGEYYLDAYTTTSLDDQQVRVVITQGSSIKGIFSIPSNMTQKTVSMFRVQLFYPTTDLSKYYLVFMPDYRLVANNTTAIRSIDTISRDSAFVVSGSK